MVQSGWSRLRMTPSVALMMPPPISATSMGAEDELTPSSLGESGVSLLSQGSDAGEGGAQPGDDEAARQRRDAHPEKRDPAVRLLWVPADDRQEEACGHQDGRDRHQRAGGSL